MRRALAILVAVLVLAAAITAVAPASLAGIALERASDGRLGIAEADGTIWQGRGTLAAGPSLRLPLRWSIDPLPLLRGELALHVAPRTEGATLPTGDIAVRRGAVMLRTLDVTLPADLVASIAPRSGLRASGEVRITSPSLEWTPTSVAGSARVVWQDAALAVSADAGANLGSVTATLAAADGRLAGPVRNEGGDYEVRGSLSIQPQGAPDATVTLTPRGGEPAPARTLTVKPAAGGSGWTVDYRAGPR